MTYQPPVFDQSAPVQWDIRFVHNPSGVSIRASVVMPGSTEPLTDAVFQSLVDKIASLPNISIVESVKTKVFKSTITPS